MPEVSALPSAARQKLEALQNTSTPPTPPAEPTPPTPTPERVTLSREELNDLRAAANAANALTARLEESELRNSALSRRLTELEESNKGNPTERPATAPAAPTAPTLPKIEAQVQFSEEEEEQFGSSKEYISKVVNSEVARLLNPILEQLGTSLAEVKQTSTVTAQRWETAEQATFARELANQVPNLRELVHHKNWAQFRDETDELSGDTMEALLSKHISRRNATQAAKIYKRFEEKYVKPITTPTNNSEYAGASPGTGVAELPADPNAPKEKLKLSKRKQASRDYINGKISYDDLQKINKAFEEAEKAGNVDYDS